MKAVDGRGRSPPHTDGRVREHRGDLLPVDVFDLRNRCDLFFEKTGERIAETARGLVAQGRKRLPHALGVSGQRIAALRAAQKHVLESSPSWALEPLGMPEPVAFQGASARHALLGYVGKRLSRAI